MGETGNFAEGAFGGSIRSFLEHEQARAEQAHLARSLANRINVLFDGIADKDHGSNAGAPGLGLHMGQHAGQLGVAAAASVGATIVDLSSIKPEQARDHAARLSEIGINHLDAPVSGGTLGAESGTLAIMVGGKAIDFERMRELLAVFGRATHVGPHGCGQLAKLANQMIVGITIGAVAEALLLCKKGGASMAKVKEAIAGGFADSRILQVHGQRMVEHNFNAHARLSIQLKDLRNALATANEIGYEAQITTLFESLYAQAADHGLSDLDHSALFLELASRNGIG